MSRHINPIWVLTIATVMSAQGALGSVASEILELTGNARTKLIWVRNQWCDENYNPIQSKRAALGANEGRYTQLVAFDTEEGTERYLDSTIGYHRVPRFTRKTGDYVIWTDSANTCAWIRDFAGTTPRRKLLTGGNYQVVHCRYDPSNGKEYIYTLASNSRTVTMIPLKDDYTADIAASTTVYTATANMGTSLGISADGIYMGTFSPWPSTMIINMTTGQKYNRHVDDAFGCQPNIAPDNSYRFFYLRSDHNVLRMWGPALSAENWDVLANRMPGNFQFLGEFYHDCVFPRWSNHPRFFTNGYPLVMWHFNDVNIFDRSSAELRAHQAGPDSCGVGVFCLGKFSQDYKTVEKYVRVTTCDVRKRDVVGDAWIANAGVDIIPLPRASDRRPGAGIVFDHAGVELRFSGSGVVDIFDTRGANVMRLRGVTRVRLRKGALPAGFYRVRITAGGAVLNTHMVLGR